jgi:hypothetical protein
VVGCCSAAAIAASLEVGLEVAAGAELVPAGVVPAGVVELGLELEHAASAVARARPAAAQPAVLAAVLAIRERGAVGIGVPF